MKVEKVYYPLEKGWKLVCGLTEISAYNFIFFLDPENFRFKDFKQDNKLALVNGVFGIYNYDGRFFLIGKK